MDHQKRISTFIVDDEQDSRDALRLLIESFCPSVDVIGESGTIKRSIDAIRDQRPELILLDIEMRDGNGFDLLNALITDETPWFKVIFVTGYDNYALRAFRYMAIDYLLKPVDPDDLREAISKVSQALHFDLIQAQSQKQFQSRELPEHLIVPGSSKHRILKFSEIGAISANGNYVFFKLMDGSEMLASRTLSYYESFLPEQVFFRAHKSHMVNLNHLRDVKTGQQNVLELSNGTEVPVSVRKKPELMKLLRERP